MRGQIDSGGLFLLVSHFKGSGPWHKSGPRCCRLWLSFHISTSTIYQEVFMLWLVTITTVVRHQSVVMAVPPASALRGFLWITIFFCISMNLLLIWLLICSFVMSYYFTQISAWPIYLLIDLLGWCWPIKNTWFPVCTKTQISSLKKEKCLLVQCRDVILEDLSADTLMSDFFQHPLLISILLMRL